MCDKCAYLEALELAGEMLIDPDYEWAEDTIQDIYAWVEENEHVTDKQLKALQNIYESVE